jgi:hypothetical protein
MYRLPASAHADLDGLLISSCRLADVLEPTYEE